MPRIKVNSKDVISDSIGVVMYGESSFSVKSWEYLSRSCKDEKSLIKKLMKEDKRVTE